MNRDDMRQRELKERDIIDITSHFQGQTRHAAHFIVVPYDIPRGCCATYYPEANVLVPLGSTAKLSNQPTSKYILVTVAPSADTGGAFDYERVDGGLSPAK